MQNMSTVSTANPIAQISEFVRTFSWAGKSPVGSWSDRRAAICAQASSHDLDHIGRFTLNKDIEHLSGEQQVKKLVALPYADIPGNNMRNYAEVFALIQAQGLTPPDLRAAEYICANRQSVRSKNPKLFATIEAYLSSIKLMTAALIFPGSIIRSNVGLADFPCLYWNGVGKYLSDNRDGRYLCSHIHEEDVFLAISD